MRQFYRSPPTPLGPPSWATAVADAVGLTDYSARASRTVVARALIYAAVLTRSVSAAARAVVGVGRETLRKALAAALPATLDLLEDRVARGLHAVLPRRARRRPLPVALDLHLRPFYGHHRTPGLCGGPPKDGARWFWGYATAVVLTPGRRHTLALLAVRRRETPDAIVERVLTQIGRTGVRIRYLLLDRGFYASGVIAALQRRRVRFIIPMVRRGRVTEPFFRRHARGWFEYTIRNRRHRADSVHVRVAAVPQLDGRPRVYVCSGGFHSLPRLVLCYRRRFGIEASYRQLGEALARTTSTDPRVRLLLVAVALLIRAWWLLGDGQPLGKLRDQLLRWLFENTSPPVPQTQPRPSTPENP